MSKRREHRAQEWTYLDEATREYVVIPELPGSAFTSDAIQWARAHGIKIEQLHRRACSLRDRWQALVDEQPVCADLEHK